MTDPTSRISELDDRLSQLPDDVLDDLLRLNTRVTRVALVPGYRQETVFFRPLRCFHSYLLLASGTGRTGTEGTALIDADVLLHCIQQGEPMHSGLHPNPTVGTTVPGRPIVSGAPIVVATGRGRTPVILTVTSDDVPADLTTPGFVNTSWGSPRPTDGSTASTITITSFLHDGSVAPRAAFGWHLTLELLFAVSIGG
jgi:hypothetical protein